jgi:DNA-directed RNA polymerase sigma subunit (sigma70/sigma32)
MKNQKLDHKEYSIEDTLQKLKKQINLDITQEEYQEYLAKLTTGQCIAFENRIHGDTFQDIANILNVTRVRAWQLYKKAVKNVQKYYKIKNPEVTLI